MKYSSEYRVTGNFKKYNFTPLTRKERDPEKDKEDLIELLSQTSDQLSQHFSQLAVFNAS